MYKVEPKLNYSIRPFEAADEAAVLGLLRVCLSSDSRQWDSPDLWQWKHQNSPFGPSYILVAEANSGGIIGVRALMRWKFSVHSRTVEAIRPVDTATDPLHQRWGIFTKLTRQALADLQASGAHLVFNTPNSQSLPGYLKMGWSPLGTLRPQFMLINPARSLPRIGLSAIKHYVSKRAPTDPTLQGQPTLSDLLTHPEIEGLLRQNQAWNSPYIRTERSVAYLKWRYEDHISIKYHAVWDESDGHMDGFLILRPITKYGLNGLTIEELILSKPDPTMSAKLIQKAANLSAAKILVACFSPGSFQRHTLERSGFRQDLRKNINFVTRILNPVSGLNPQRIQSWDLSMGDLEFL